MKKIYEAPKAEKLEFDYTDTVAASGSEWEMHEFTDNISGCNSTPTDNWFLNFVRENGCKQIRP